jgi:NAD(P)-dependent dehydrogenase (short-subunit alcohol dehydrogenase family)
MAGRASGEHRGRAGHGAAGRRGALRPGDVAATVAFLASDGAAALTGQVLCTDGGLVMR